MSDTWDSAPLATTAPAAPAATWDSAPVVAGASPQQKAVVSANDNGDEAAKALTISKRTQIPASVVQSDLPGYDAHARQQSAVKAVQNPAIAKYVDGNPMAAKVSGDDYDKLDEVSQYFENLKQDRVNNQAHAGVFAGIAEVGNLLTSAPGREKLLNALTQLPAAIGKGLLDFVQTPGRVMSGDIDLNTPEGLNQGIGFGLGVALGGRDISVGRSVDAAGVATSTSADVDAFLGKLRGMKTRQEIDDFIASKQEGPPGAQLQVAKAETASDSLSQAVEAAQESKTKLRSPETFAEFGDAHDAGNVHIDAGKMMELYQKEGKVPADGDGLFGFVPGLAERLQAGEATGGEITIPIGQYVAHVDPAVHEGLKDSIRVHDDGITLAEAEEHKAAVEAYHGTPHDFEKFDLTKVGTGEGAQVYGHGLYFAENKAVGEEYQRNLSQDSSSAKIDGKPYDPENIEHRAALAIAEKGDRASAVYEAETYFMQMSNEAVKYPEYKDAAQSAKKVLDLLKSDKVLPKVDKGTLYKVSIAADPTHFLDWDKPLAEQGPEVQAIMRKQLEGQLWAEGRTLDKISGEEFYKNLGDKETASKALAEAGIPGIKYLDQGSRGAGDGTRNFVVFDDKLVKIKEKNGNPIVDAVEAATEAARQSLHLRPEPFMTLLFKDAKSIGITDSEFKAYSDKIARAEESILDKAVSFHRAQVAKALTPEWKRQEASVRDEVTEEFRTQGPFAAEKFLRDNKIDIAHERAAEVADQLAPVFGYANGQDLLRGLESIDTERAASGKGPDVQRRDAIKAETAQRMEARHGNLAENIAKEARQTALADHTFDILADEVRLLARAAGVAPPLGRTEMVDWAKASFERSNLQDAANWEKHRRAVEKGGREAEKALLKGDFLEAFQAKQRQMLAAVRARQSLDLQKVIDATEKKIDRFSSEPTIPSIDQAHLDQIRQVLASVGLPQHIPAPQDIGSLRDFVTASEGQIAVAPWLMEGATPQIKDMNVDQFRAFANSIKSFEHVGRQTTKLFSAQKEAELQNVVFDIKKELERFPFIDQPNNPSLAQRAGSVWRKVIGAHLLVERMLDYTDKFDPHGPLTEWLDRPLRDANSKELAMTEQVTRMLKDLRQHVDGSILDPVENNLIPDRMDKSGFLQMNRQNLRVLMLNMGNWSNIKKLGEGFGVNEADLRRMVDANASAQDIAWVNGVWKVFQHLKPEADAVQLRDTGVPVDTVPAVPWEVKGGKLDGGYYPLSYNRYNSDIQGHIAQPLFDKGYFAATTPHGYTQARTEYKGAIDLSGDFLASKIKSMVHDIAFREAVRNAERLIKNQEFRTALAQRWGKEAADLLPGWLRDIANSHTIDDDYAQGFQRASSLVRQNVVSTLIAYNPGTFIKHGFTAAVMSMDRVGLKNLLKATGDVGFSGAAKNVAELLNRADRVPDENFMQTFRDSISQGQKGENARQFVLDSSAVMRARQRQYEDSIFGAVQAISKIGRAQTFAEFRQRQMQYGRLAVAFSDQMSAIPTWLAAYKKAYLAGETHEDAVFQADKEMSRAHGSSFIGDKPLVSRVANTPTGEFMRWFTSLYNFFNHAANNNFQLAWDASAALGGNPGGEPGANAASISRRVGLIIAIIAIEELAGPAKDENGHGILARSLLAGMRFFGAGFVGVREITNGLAHGYEPSTGMIGTLFKAGSDTVKDIGRATGTKAGIAKDWITHTATALGFLTGVGGSQLGRTGQFGADVATGRDRPQTFNDYRQGLRTGHSKARKFK